MPPTASTSNPSRFLAPFGLLPCLPQLQRPIRHAFLLLLDLCLLPRSFNVQSTTVSCSFWTSACFPAASTSNPSRFLTPSGLLPCLPQLQRPIRHAFLLLLDFHMPPAASTSNPSRFLAPFGLPHASHSFNVQSVTLSCSFWTSTCLPQLQRPIHHGFLLLLDFCHASRSFNVQSARIYSTTLDFCLLPRSFNVQSTTVSCSFWTSAMPPTASTSNPSRFLAPFGLPHASRSFNVQSVTLSCSFWTSAYFPAALTSNPSRFLAPFGLPHASRSFNVQSTTLSCSFWTSTCLTQLQRPIRHAFLLLLDFCHASHSFNIQSVTLSCSFWTSACFPAASTSNPPCIQATLASPQPQALHNAKKQHQHISASIALYLLILF